MKTPTIKHAALCLGLLGLTTALVPRAQASPLANDAFDQYANGTTLTASGNWVAFSGAGVLPLTTSQGTVTATNVASGGSGEDDRITFASAPIAGVLYYSTLVTVPTGTTASVAGDYFFSGYSTGGGYLGRVFLNQATDGGLAFGLTNSTAAPAAGDGADLTLGSEYRIVLRVDTTAHTATFNYQLATATPFTSDSQLSIAAAGAVGTIGSLDSVAIRQGTGSAFTTIIDGVQAGTTLADVSSIQTGPSAFFNANAPVPEPSTYAAMIAGAGLLGLALRARRTA